jgi:hypothetical protein
VRAGLLSYAELSLWLCACKKIEEDNKEEEELVDVAPHWGEPRISCVIVLCAMLFLYFLSEYVMIDRSI